MRTESRALIGSTEVPGWPLESSASSTQVPGTSVVQRSTISASLHRTSPPHDAIHRIAQSLHLACVARLTCRSFEPPSLELVSWLPCRGHKENSSHAAHFQTSRGVCAAMVSCGITPEANISIGCACARGAQHRARPLDQRTRGPASGCASIVSRY
jgi:hypothetical protein